MTPMFMLPSTGGPSEIHVRIRNDTNEFMDNRLILVEGQQIVIRHLGNHIDVAFGPKGRKEWVFDDNDNAK